MIAPVITKHQCIPRIIWRALAPAARLVLLANGDVEINEDGLPVVRCEMLAATLKSVEEALGIA
jgi:hypothetical protein